MKLRIGIALILALGVCAGWAQQAAVVAVPSGSQSDVKALEAAITEKDMAKRVTLLEAFIQDNPKSSALSIAYSSLLMAYRTTDRDKGEKLADELLAKYTDAKNPIRRTALSAKIMNLMAQKKTAELHALAQKVLDTETDALTLMSATIADRDLADKLFEKALVERAKDPSATAAPSLDDIRWQHAQALLRIPARKADGLKMSQDVLDAANKAIADAGKLPAEDPARRRAEAMKRTMASRYQSLSRTMSDAGDYDKALQYLDLSIPKDPMGALESRSSNEMLRADIYAKMKKPDLQMECYAKAYAARMDKSTADKIAELAKTTGANTDKVYARARKLRKEGATPIKPFELKSIEGKMTTIASVKGKVTLVNFFFPT
jgi:tetratricopeptide (TPR) repeat protein